MCLGPQVSRADECIDPDIIPPCGFITAAVNLAVMTEAERDGELVTHLAPERPVLRKAKGVDSPGASAKNQVRLLHKRI